MSDFSTWATVALVVILIFCPEILIWPFAYLFDRWYINRLFKKWARKKGYDIALLQQKIPDDFLTHPIVKNSDEVCYMEIFGEGREVKPLIVGMKRRAWYSWKFDVEFEEVQAKEIQHLEQLLD